MAVESGISAWNNPPKPDNIISFAEKSVPKDPHSGDSNVEETSINTIKFAKALGNYEEEETQSPFTVNKTSGYAAPTPVNTQQSFIKEEIVPKDKIIGQYKDTYILIELEDGLEIVDQHIADERYIYEKLKSRHNPESQLLFVSDVIKLDDKDSEIIKNNIDKFEKFGYGLEFLNDNEVIFRKIPQMLSKYAPKEILSDILENIEGDIDNLEEKILITTSCKAAVKANTPLNLFQMEEIIARWRTCKKPHTCPHGRPISKIIPHHTIAGFFMRQK